MKAVWKTFACLLCATLLASCGSSLVYDRLDWLIPWYVDSYVDLSKEQRQTLREQLAPLLQQHRQEELVRYLQLLDEIEASLQSRVEQAQVGAWIERLQQAAERIEESMLRVGVEFGATISEAQMEEFVASLYLRQTELEEELLERSDEEYAKENTKHLQDLMERIIGRLEYGQKQRLQQAAGAVQRFDAVWLQDRRLWLDQLKLLLQRESGWQERLLRTYRDRERNRSAEYLAIVSHNKQVVAASIAEVLNNRNSKQREHTHQEFEELRSMLKKLIANPPIDPETGTDA